MDIMDLMPQTPAGMGNRQNNLTVEQRKRLTYLLGEADRHSGILETGKMAELIALLFMAVYDLGPSEAKLLESYVLQEEVKPGSLKRGIAFLIRTAA